MKFTKFSKTFILQSICEQLLLWIAPPSLDITVHLKLKVSQLYSMIHVKYLKTRQHFLHPSIVFTELYNTEAVAQRCSVRKGVFRNITKFTGKHLCQSLFFNKVAGLRAAIWLKKKLWLTCFPVIFAKCLRTAYLQNTSGWLLLILFVACFFIFFIKNFHHEKSRFVRKKSTSGKPALHVCFWFFARI